MNNFLEFIRKDIEAKKTLITSLPTKTKTNIKKYNQTLETIESKYAKYKDSLDNYMEAKSRAIKIKEEDKTLEIEKLKEKITTLEEVKRVLNPFNSYLEKMGFDTLLYEINNYTTFNFTSLNDIINAFLDKFEMAGILLTANDFSYTCYVHEYMSAFLEVRRKNSTSYEKVSEIFEQIYWINPDIIEHIELNLRKLIRDNEKKFNLYISQYQKDVMAKNKIESYNNCLEKLQSLYIDLNMLNKESVSDIVSLAKSGQIDIEHLRENNRNRISAYDALIPKEIDVNNKEELNKVCTVLEKLKLNIEEYNNYLEFLPLFNNFKEEYEKLVGQASNEDKGLKEIENKITAKENELERINKKIFNGKPGLFEFKSDNDLKHLKAESVLKAKELFALYKDYDREYFKSKVMSILSDTLSVADLLNLYYSYDYFRKLAIRKAYNTDNYQEVLNYSNRFDNFAKNPTNVIVVGIPIFTDVSVAKIIVNKYNLSNIKLEENSLEPSNLQSLLNKITLILRVNKIENTKDLNVEKVWFIVKVATLNKQL